MTIDVKTTEKSWQALTPDERLERRVQAWLSPRGVNFVSTEAEAEYKARITRLSDAFQMKKLPDRVPVLATGGLANLAAAYCGYTQKETLYEVDKSIDAAIKSTLGYQFDARIPPSAPVGRVYEILGNKTRSWPGHGVPDDGEDQFVENEYMKADEYDAYLEDPSDFHWRTYLPRTWGAAEALAKLMPLSQLNQNNVARFALPEVQETLRKFLEAGQEILSWQPKIAAANRRLTELGFPSQDGAAAFGGAPFDRLGDSLRGTRGIVWDMFRQPDKLLHALDVITGKTVRAIRRSAGAGMGECPFVGFALHKGADGFMSDEQFRTFYWPTLRQICIDLVEQGYVPWLRAQGAYNSRLKAICDLPLPKGKVVWQFHLIDVAKAEEAVGDSACIAGSVPNSLLCTGTPEQVEIFSRQLIDTSGKDGGFILCTQGAPGRTSKPENIRAMIRVAKEYGVYSR